ncbi:capsid protein, partial [Listeria monocytogenes]|nr:capsid protein [Listeria monocytogenes]
NRPFINEADEQGWFVFLLDFQAKLTTFKGEK